MLRLSSKLATMTLLAFGFAFTSCEKEAGNELETGYLLEVQKDGATTFLTTNLKSVIDPTTTSTTSEADMLQYLKEEEKLARDVYTALAAKWNTPIFNNIATAEQTHVNAVVGLINTIGGDATVLPAGQFQNPAFTELYTQLVAQGSQSVTEAYKVGALIEEKDIYDIKKDLAAISNSNITIVMENLLKASSNHLRAFTKQLTALGVTYTPVYLDQATFDQTIASPMEQGKRYQYRKGAGNGNGKGKGNC